MISIAYGGSTKESEVSFSAGIDEGFPPHLVIAPVIVGRDARDVISVTGGGNKRGVQTNLHTRVLTQLLCYIFHELRTPEDGHSMNLESFPCSPQLPLLLEHLLG